MPAIRRAVQPLERLEQPVDLVGRDDLAGVGHGQHHSAYLAVDADLDGATGHVVVDRVVAEVDQQPAEQHRVTRYPRRLQRGLHPQPAPLGLGCPLAQRQLDQFGEVNHLIRAAAMLAAGQGEQRLQQLPALVADDQEPLEVRPERLQAGPRIDQRLLEQRTLDRQRSTHLVGGVGDEPLVRVERGLQPSEQPVDRVSQVLQLVAGAGQGQPLVHIAFGDLVQAFGHGQHRTQYATGDQPAEEQRDRRHDGQRDQGLYQPIAGGAVSGDRRQRPGAIRVR